MQPYSLRHLTDSEIKKFIRGLDGVLYTTSGRYEICKTVEEAKSFLEANLNRTFYCKAIRSSFVLSVQTAEHFFGKSRTSEDYLRRSKLMSVGLEILEESPMLLVIDRDSDRDSGVVYYEILGKDERMPGKIINSKLSEIKEQGKIFWTIVDIDCR